MSSRISPNAGQPAGPDQLIDVQRLLDAYVDLQPDPAQAAQRVSFGTSGHRGVSHARSFNEWHVLTITQALCDYRASHGIDGPLFLGIDTHALSAPAQRSTLEVLAANGVHTRIAAPGGYTPTPAISHAILCHNRGRSSGLADGIVITPSHNPPDNGGYKYNPPNGGPADSAVTQWVQQRANALLEARLQGVRRLPAEHAIRSDYVQVHDFLNDYVADLGAVIDFDCIRASGLRMAVDPLGGAGVDYWGAIAEHYRLDLQVVSATVDPQFGFMSLDWDGQIRMDPSSAYAMRRLLGLKDRFDLAFACDTDHDRHGIVTPGAGLMPTNHYLAVAIDYLMQQRPQWHRDAAIGKTVVSSAMIDRVAKRLGRRLFEVPVGYKWFVPGLFDGSLGFTGEESAGMAFLRRDGSAWTTDKDGITAGLLAAEISASDGRDPGQRYLDLCNEFGSLWTDRVEAHANPAQKRALAQLAPAAITQSMLAGEAISAVLDRAPGNDAAIGGIKVVTAGGWFAARPSGTEDIYKIYAESARSAAHLQALLADAQRVVDQAIAGA